MKRNFRFSGYKIFSKQQEEQREIIIKAKDIISKYPSRILVKTEGKRAAASKKVENKLKIQDFRFLLKFESIEILVKMWEKVRQWLVAFPERG